MIQDPKSVREILLAKVLAGYSPEQTHESCVDHRVDWTVLSADDFQEVLRDARARPAVPVVSGQEPTRVSSRSASLVAAMRPLLGLLERYLGLPPSDDQLREVIATALGSARVVDDLAELYRAEPAKIRSGMAAGGLPIVSRVERPESAGDGKWFSSEGPIVEKSFRMSAQGPALNEAYLCDAESLERLETEWETHLAKVRASDPFLRYYRVGVADYIKEYRATISPQIHRFVQETFGSHGPRYVVTVGIGANEQFWHFPKRWWDLQRSDPRWLIADNPKDIRNLPADASVVNTLVLEFSRSGKTQEVVKFDEYLDPSVPRIVFANAGPLAVLAHRRSRSLQIAIPDEIPGRFSKNLSPILIAPMDVLGMPFEKYWNEIASHIEAWDLCRPTSPPVVLARYLRAGQLVHGANHIYLGSNDELLLGSCDELVQFWNEGVNKGNDYSMSRYFGLPRDSHLNIEGLLANGQTKASIFLLRRGGDSRFAHRLRAASPGSLISSHSALSIADVDYILARANVDHFGTKMPTVLIELDDVDLFSSAALSQLWTDTVYVYSNMIGVNPGSNPEVRYVRDRAEGLLSGAATK